MTVNILEGVDESPAQPSTPFQVSAPIAPGVPPINQTPGFDGSVQPIFQDLVTDAQFGTPTWGVYQGGVNVITADVVTSVDYRQEWAISDFPQEAGAFESYDKVQVPFDVRVRFASGGSEAARTALLDSITAVAGSLTLFDVVTPTAVYNDANIVHVDYRRTNESGVGLLQVDVWLQEVRPNGSSAQTAYNPLMPSGADTVNGGTVEAEPVTTPVGSGGIGAA